MWQETGQLYVLPSFRRSVLPSYRLPKLLARSSRTDPCHSRSIGRTLIFEPVFETIRPALPILVAAVALSGCNPQAQEAKQQREACEAGNAQACDTFALRLRQGDHVLKDYGRAAELFQHACDAGVAEGCATVGNMYLIGQGVDADTALAATIATSSLTSATNRSRVFGA